MAFISEAGQVISQHGPPFFKDVPQKGKNSITIEPGSGTIPGCVAALEQRAEK